VATVETIVQSIKSVGRSKNTQLVLDNQLTKEESDSLVIQADAPKLEQAFLNIASNSIKFSPENSELKIIISKTSLSTIADSNSSTPFTCSRKLEYAGALTLSFVDNGVGIEPENLSKVFGEFSQFDPDKLQGGGGTGLGLFITRNIVKCHNGSIDVFSEGIGHGTRFSLTLPSYTFCSIRSSSSSVDVTHDDNSDHAAATIKIPSQSRIADGLQGGNIYIYYQNLPLFTIAILVAEHVTIDILSIEQLSGLYTLVSLK
jgi:hypothetical protein